MQDLGVRAVSAAATAQRVVSVARELFEERGFDAVTMDDVAEAAGCDRRTVYRAGRGRVELLLAAGQELTGPLFDTRTLTRVEQLPDVAMFFAERHSSTAGLELMIRGVARSGVPRIRSFISGLDLVRRDEAAHLFGTLIGRADWRLPLLEHLTGVHPYAHLVDRDGWGERAYEQWLIAELMRLRYRNRT